MATTKRPVPPPGYVAFKWKTRPNETDKSVREILCPVCGNFGSSWCGGGWQDPGAQAFYDSTSDLLSYDHLCQDYEGVMLKSHWSRFGEGECRTCGVKYWHDFIDYPWQYYYSPSTANVCGSKPVQLTFL